MKIALTTQLAASISWAFNRAAPPDLVLDKQRVYLYYPSFLNLAGRKECEAILRRYHAKEPQ